MKEQQIAIVVSAFFGLGVAFLVVAMQAVKRLEHIRLSQHRMAGTDETRLRMITAIRDATTEEINGNGVSRDDHH